MRLNKLGDCPEYGTIKENNEMIDYFKLEGGTVNEILIKMYRKIRSLEDTKTR